MATKNVRRSSELSTILQRRVVTAPKKKYVNWTPSAFLEKSVTKAQRLASTRELRRSRILPPLDTSESSCDEDYSHQITCVTDKGQFIERIRASCARAFLDFPLHLNFSTCPVKYSSQKTLLVRNLGNREAHYSISTQSPFSVDRSIRTLGIGEAMQVTVDFHPLKTGYYCGSLIVHYDTGENTKTNLYGVAVDVNIRLDEEPVSIEKTYLTLSKRRCVAIHNRSDIIARFQWKACGTQEEEDQRERSIPDQSAKVQGESLLSSDGIFSIEPAEGEILPNCSAEISVTFKPEEARVYQQKFYCDISGRETRLPLCIQGEGIGPRLRSSFDHRVIGDVFMGAEHKYEVVLFNKGLIRAVFSLVPPATALGSCFTFLPSEGEILPGDLQVIQISFSSTILGQFREEFKFNVNGSPEPVTLTISGCVIGPTFHFDVPALCFGDVSFGFPHTLSCRLKNTSLVPMTFHLRIPGDGSGRPSVTSAAWLSNDDPEPWRWGVEGSIRPAEFTIEPRSGTIRALGSRNIKVTLCSNTVKKYKLALVVDVDGVGKEVLGLLLTARCIAPELEVRDPTVTFGRCFLNFQYERPLTLENKSRVPACYRLLPQKHEQGDAVLYSSPVFSGIIKPYSSVSIPLVLEAQKLGHQSASAVLAVLGNKKSPLAISLKAVGEGPVVHVYPSKINFGNIQVLADASRTLYLCNQSVIPASFRAEVAGKRSRCRIEPSKGVIPPETKVAVTVIANLDDIEQFKDKVIVSIENSHSYSVLIRAFGIGTTIVTDKPLAPELNLGPHFSLDPCCYHFKITNAGRRIHRLYWRTEGSPPFPHPDRLPATQTKGEGSSKNPRPASSVFKIQPLTMELMPGQTVEMTLEGSSSTPQVVKERLLCHAIVGNQFRKRRIMQVAVTCEFIAPTLQVSSRAMSSRVEKQPSDVLSLQYKPLSLKNTSSLPLSIVLMVEQPFWVCSASQQPLPDQVFHILPLYGVLQPGESERVRVTFSGHADIIARVTALCRVEGGPTYEVALRGEASLIHYLLDSTEMDCGLQLFTEVTKSEVTLRNSGKMGFTYVVLSPSTATADSPQPGVPLVLPSTVDKYFPLYLKQKLLRQWKNKHCVFQVLPLAGTLTPGQRYKVRVRFTPRKEAEDPGFCSS